MADHTHDVRDLDTDVAPAFHEHDMRDLRGVAPEGHSHGTADLGGVPNLTQFRLLQDQVAALEQRMQAERIALEEAIAHGHGPVELIADAIDHRCDLMAGFDRHQYLRTELRKLAQEIRETRGRPAT